MISFVKALQDSTCNLVVYSGSQYMEYILRGLLRERFNVDKECVFEVPKSLSIDKLGRLINIPPMIGDRWLVFVNVSNVSFDKVKKHFENLTDSAICVFVCENYRDFKKLEGLKFVHDIQGANVFRSLKKVSFLEVDELFSHIVGDKGTLEYSLMNFLKKGYRYDPNGICSLFMQIKSGIDIESKKDIVDAIGIGGNTISFLVVKLLMLGIRSKSERFMSFKPKKEMSTSALVKRRMRDILKFLEDLLTTYDENSIGRFMINTLDGFLFLKEMYISGRYTNFYKSIPKEIIPKNLEKTIKVLSRFDYVLFREVPVTNILVLRECLYKGKGCFYTKEDLIESLYKYSVAVINKQFVGGLVS